MNPIICYLYEYRLKNRLRNVGFIKIQPRYKTYHIEIHVKGIPIQDGENWPLFIFYKDADSYIAFPLLDLVGDRRNINMQFDLPESALPDQKAFQDMNGFLLKGPHQELFIATWTNADINTESFRDYKPGTIEILKSEDIPDTIPNTADPDEPAPILLEDDFVEAEALSCPPVECEEQSCHNTPQLTEIARKIQRSELTVLPKKFWHLANNSFLLHGYYNYNHLLLVENEGHCWLGVPGISDPRETRAAESFGFPQFTQEYLPQLELTEDECNRDENFGHWCRYIM